ncbi:hypothetical protein ACL02T_09715 [Pseudonocardia sp. RS010]|uniref:hypothetical protein n=1 Tax=Pseudonocardia sp. RS010 TaxID=3385979 RepID=UPI0039A0C08E
MREIGLIEDIVYLGVIPVVLLTILAVAAWLPGSLSKREIRLSARAGFLLGLVVFAVYALKRPLFPNAELSITRDGTPLFTFDWVALVVGVAAGAAMPLLLRATRGRSTVGLVTALLAAAAPCALLTQLYAPTWRVAITLGTLAAVFMALLVATLRPALIHKLI